MKVIRFYRIKELRDALEGLPDERTIACQVIGSEKGAWNMWGEFCPEVVPRGIACLTFRHDMIRTLPEYDEEGMIVKDLNFGAIPWQLCPKCQGQGIITNQLHSTTSGISRQCDVCNGRKIILMHR